MAQAWQAGRQPRPADSGALQATQGACCLQVGQSADVVGDGHHLKHYPRSRQTESSHQHTAHGAQGPEGMLYPGAGHNPQVNRLRGPRRQRALRRALGQDMAAVAVGLQSRFPLLGTVGRVGPDIRTGIGRVEQEI